MIRHIAPAFLLLATLGAHAQYFPPDTAALEDILVETYYVCDANDAGDVDGGPGLVAGAVVYRIYADLKPGYIVQTIYVRKVEKVGGKLVNVEIAKIPNVKAPDHGKKK